MTSEPTHPALSVSFAPPDRGWIDMTIVAGNARIEYSLSEVYDPFKADFRRWFEGICDTGQPWKQRAI
jgi:hypothetical protein